MDGLKKLLLSWAALAIGLSLLVSSLRSCGKTENQSLSEWLLDALSLVSKALRGPAGPATDVIVNAGHDAADAKYVAYLCRYEAAKKEGIRVGVELGPCELPADYDAESRKLITLLREHNSFLSVHKERPCQLKEFQGMACCQVDPKKRVSLGEAAYCALHPISGSP